jgi:hypothetical protein
LRSIRDAWASRSEHFSQGIDTGPVSSITMSASGVVSIAFAKTGFVLLCTIPSEMFPPSKNELIEMFKDYLPHLALQTRRAVVFKVLDDIEAVRLQPSISVQ